MGCGKLIGAGIGTVIAPGVGTALGYGIGSAVDGGGGGGLFGTKPEAPDVQGYESQLKEALAAQSKMMPQLYGLEKYWQPKWDELGTERMNRYLEPGGMMDTYAAMGGRLGDISSDINTQQRAADIGDVSALGPQAYAAMRGFNPQQTELMDALNEQALQQAQLGGRMTPDQQRMIQNSVMGQRSAQGWGYNPGDMAEAMRQATGYSDQLQQSRMRQAQLQAGQNQAVYGDPFMQILGRQGTAFGALPGTAAGMMQAQQGAGPTLFQPESQMAFDIWNTGYQGELGSNIAGSNNRAALFGAGINAFGQMAGAGMGAAAMCWVARSTFGAHDVRWLQFRRWLLNHGPRWFQALYFWAGPTVSAWLDKKGPVARRVRPWIKRWMQARIDGMNRKSPIANLKVGGAHA